MLKCYSKLDRRVKIIGVLVKKWASLEGMCSTFNKYLSSYTYIILVIHYFQQKGMLPYLNETRMIAHVPEMRIKNHKGRSHICTFYDMPKSEW